jgi:hypothetical protein
VQPTIRRLLFKAGPGWLVSGVGVVTSLRQLGTVLNANPSADVTMRGNYNAVRDGVFTAGGGIISSVYTGTFDGGGYTISNITVLNSSPSANDGLFANIGSAGVVRDLTIRGYFALTNVSLVGYLGPMFVNGNKIGSLAAINNGLIENCSSTATVISSSSGSNNGGLVGLNNVTGQIIGGECNTNVSLTIDGFNTYLANCCGQNWGLIDGVIVRSGSCFAPSGNMSPGVTNFLGTNETTGAWQGVIFGANGKNEGEGTLNTAIVQNCETYIDVVGSTSVNVANYAGALGGINLEGQVLDNEAFGSASGAADVGGLLGRQSETNSLAARNIARGNAVGIDDRVGGLVGDNYGTLSENWALGNATGVQNVSGGVGLNRSSGVIDHLETFGAATGSIRVAGAVGQNQAGGTVDQALVFGTSSGSSGTNAVIGLNNGTITNSAYCIESVGRTATVTGVEAKTEAQLQAGLPTGFDSKWSITGGTTGGLPYLNTVSPAPPAPTIPTYPQILFIGNAATQGSATVSMPAGIQSGDFAVLYDLAQNTTTSGPATASPAGWTVSQNSVNTNTHGTRQIVSYKVLDGTETTLTGMAAGTRGTMKEIYVFRGTAGTTWTITGANNQTNGAGTGIAAQVKNGGVAPCVYVGRGVSDGGTFANPMITGGDDAGYLFSDATLISASAYRTDSVSTTQRFFTGDVTNGCATASFVVSRS